MFIHCFNMAPMPHWIKAIPLMMAWQGCNHLASAYLSKPFLHSVAHTSWALWSPEHLLFSSFTIYSSFIYVCGCFSAYMDMHHLYASCLWRPEEVDESSTTRVTDGWESACICWEATPGVLHGQQVLRVTEPSLSYHLNSQHGTLSLEMPYLYFLML